MFASLPRGNRLLKSVAIACLCGCGGGDGLPQLYPVTGQILLDGKPVPNATVVFEPIRKSDKEFGRPGNAYSDAEGRIAPWTLRAGDGLPAGKFRVGIISQKQVGGPPLTESTTSEQYARVKWEWLVPERYSDPRKSNLEIEVTSEGMKPQIINLTSK